MPYVYVMVILVLFPKITKCEQAKWPATRVLIHQNELSKLVLAQAQRNAGAGTRLATLYAFMSYYIFDE